MIIPNKVYVLFYNVLKKKFLKTIPVDVRNDIENTDVNFWEKLNDKTNKTYFREAFPKITDERHFYKRYRKAIKDESFNPTEKDAILIDLMKNFMCIDYPIEISQPERKDPDIKAALLMQVFLERYGFPYLLTYFHLYVFDRLDEKFRWESNSVLRLDMDSQRYSDKHLDLSQTNLSTILIQPRIDRSATLEPKVEVNYSDSNRITLNNSSAAEASLVEIKTRRNFDRFENIISSANQEVIVTGTNFDGVLNMHQRINALAKTGIRFRFMALNPDGQVLQYSSKFSDVDYQKRKTKILNNLELLQDKIGVSIRNGMVELGLFDGFASTGHIGLDIAEDEGKIIVQHYLYHNAADFAPLFTLNAAVDHFWFKIYKRQLDKMWRDSEKIK